MKIKCIEIIESEKEIDLIDILKIENAQEWNKISSNSNTITKKTENYKFELKFCGEYIHLTLYKPKGYTHITILTLKTKQQYSNDEIVKMVEKGINWMEKNNA